MLIPKHLHNIVNMDIEEKQRVSLPVFVVFRLVPIFAVVFVWYLGFRLKFLQRLLQESLRFLLKVRGWAVLCLSFYLWWTGCKFFSQGQTSWLVSRSCCSKFPDLLHFPLEKAWLMHPTVMGGWSRIQPERSGSVGFFLFVVIIVQPIVKCWIFEIGRASCRERV